MIWSPLLIVFAVGVAILTADHGTISNERITRDELEARLAELAPISSKSQDPVYKHYRSVLGLGAFLMWIAVSIVINKTLVVITGVLSIGLYIWAYYEIQTNNNLSENRKKRSYIYFLFILLVLSTMYTKLANWAL